MPTDRTSREMDDAQIKHMTERFLMWSLPESFNPDAGISFAPEFNVEWNAKQGQPPQRHNPTGTNLFDYTQAEAMVRHMVEGLPPPTQSEPEVVERVALVRQIIDAYKPHDMPTLLPPISHEKGIERAVRVIAAMPSAGRVEEPTDAMCDAALHEWKSAVTAGNLTGNEIWKRIYSAMNRAALSSTTLSEKAEG